MLRILPIKKRRLKRRFFPRRMHGVFDIAHKKPHFLHISVDSKRIGNSMPKIVLKSSFKFHFCQTSEKSDVLNVIFLWPLAEAQSLHVQNHNFSINESLQFSAKIT